MTITITVPRPRVPSWRLPRLSPLQRQVAVLFASLALFTGGAAIVGVWCLGVAVMADGVFGVWFALFRDVAESQPSVADVHGAVMERYRRSA